MTDDSGDDGDRLLRLAGIGLVAGILIAFGVMAAAFAAGPSGDPGVANTTWQLDRVNDPHVRIVLAEGEPVRGEDLVVTVDSYERQASPPRVVAENDSFLVEYRSNQVLRLYHDPGRGDSTLLGAWRPTG